MLVIFEKPRKNAWVAVIFLRERPGRGQARAPTLLRSSLPIPSRVGAGLAPALVNARSMQKLDAHPKCLMLSTSTNATGIMGLNDSRT
jgi:hypothetical protein